MAMSISICLISPLSFRDGLAGDDLDFHILSLLLLSSGETLMTYTLLIRLSKKKHARLH